MLRDRLNLENEHMRENKTISILFYLTDNMERYEQLFAASFVLCQRSQFRALFAHKINNLGLCKIFYAKNEMIPSFSSSSSSIFDVDSNSLSFTAHNELVIGGQFCWGKLKPSLMGHFVLCTIFSHIVLATTSRQK
jgi:hypothetical protein